MGGDGSRSKQSSSSMNTVKLLMAGAGSGAITKTSIAPLERIKILFQIQGMQPDVPVKYTGIVQTFRTVVTEEGVVALWKGNGANVVRILPTYALKFAFNDTFKDMLRTHPGEKLGALHMMGAGTMAGLTQITLTYPLEVVRTRLTLSEGMSGGIRYKGILHCFQHTVKHESVTALYKGIGPTWLSGAPYVGLQMTAYDTLKGLIPKREDGTRNPLYTLPAGGAAGLFAQTLTYPGDTIRRRMQTNGIGGRKKIYSSSMDAVMKTVRGEGIAGLYKGLTANAVRCIPGAAIQFFAYDNLKFLFGL